MKTWKNVSILGRTIFNGNKAITEDVALGANIDAPMSSFIDGNYPAKVYYSENAEATKDLDNSQNGWTEAIEDIKMLNLIWLVLDNDLKIGDILTYILHIILKYRLIC